MADVPESTGGLSLTLHFRDAGSLGMFIRTAHELTLGNGMGGATPEQSDQWTAFLSTLVRLLEEAPKTPFDKHPERWTAEEERAFQEWIANNGHL